ncbi:hypothetical protein CI102_13514 [Trichoderma harzianum]|nr:hypothetical protein CI102_13514 [Trichoderma harzianum]
MGGTEAVPETALDTRNVWGDVPESNSFATLFLPSSSFSLFHCFRCSIYAFFLFGSCVFLGYVCRIYSSYLQTTTAVLDTLSFSISSLSLILLDGYKK